MHLTWADSDVAELGLSCGAAARLSSILGLLAGAGSVTVTAATRGGAQAPGGPLIPSTIHCKHVRNILNL